MDHDLILQGLTNSVWLWFVVPCCIAALSLMTTLLRYERKLVSRRVGYWLLALRVALIFLLILMFLEPVSSWSLDRQKSGRVIVAVDVSESTNTIDRYATRGELLRWARALELIGNQHTAQRLEGWIRAYETDTEPTWVEPNEAASEAQRQELARVRKEHVEAIIDQARQIPRKELARRLLSTTSAPLLPQLEAISHVELRVFAGESQGVDKTLLDQVLEQPAETLQPQQSDLGVALDIAAADETAQVTGVVVITDGRHNRENDPVPLAARVGAMGAPVIPLMIGSVKRPRDVAIVSVDAPQVAFKNDTPIMKARIAAAGFEQEELTIHLNKPDGTVETKTLRVGTDASTAVIEVDFGLPAEEIGRKVFNVRTDVRPGETRDDNNEREFAIQIVDDKARVLLVDGAARWEFRFINNAYSRDERVELTPVLYNQPYLGLLPATFFPRQVTLPDTAPDGKSALGQHDLIVIGDVAPQQVGDTLWDAFEKFVRDDGGTLVLTAGKHGFPRLHRSPALARMFPMRDLRILDLDQINADQPPTERGFHLRLTPDGEKQTMFHFSTDAIENRNLWNQLPGHLWGMLGEARPGATVFATARHIDVGNLDDERKNAVIVHQYYGFGQVLWMGIDSTWRWRHRVGDQYHHRFWGQLARWAAENKAAAGNSFVRLSLRENPVQAGQDAVVQTRWDSRFVQQHPNFKAFVEVFANHDQGGANAVARQPLKDVEGRPLVSEAHVGGLSPGSYKLRIVTEGADLGPTEVSTMLYVQEPTTGELSDLSANRELLDRLAAAGHGRVVLPDEVSAIPDLISPPESRSQIREETTLWDHWLTLLVFFTLLTTEWIVRKLNGLP